MLIIFVAALSFFPDTSRRGRFEVDARLCESVKGYREYNPHATGLLRPGGRAVVYMEPRGFRVTSEGSNFILRLRYDWKLYTEEGKEIPVRAWLECSPNDRFDQRTSPNPIREFHQQFRLPLPKSLQPGKYRIRITVENEGRARGSDLWFTIPAE